MGDLEPFCVGEVVRVAGGEQTARVVWRGRYSSSIDVEGDGWLYSVSMLHGTYTVAGVRKGVILRIQTPLEELAQCLK